jgi:hypothetical protein
MPFGTAPHNANFSDRLACRNNRVAGRGDRLACRSSHEDVAVIGSSTARVHPAFSSIRAASHLSSVYSSFVGAITYPGRLMKAIGNIRTASHHSSNIGAPSVAIQLFSGLGSQQDGTCAMRSRPSVVVASNGALRVAT